MPGGLGDLLPPPIIQKPPPRQQPRKPRSDETAIEAPYRLIISPSVLGGFAHATEPRVGARPTRTASSCGTAGSACDGWTRTASSPSTSAQTRSGSSAPSGRGTTRSRSRPVRRPVPFRMSLDRIRPGHARPAERRPAITVPQPVSAERLALSSLGAWLDLHRAAGTSPSTRRPASAEHPGLGPRRPDGTRPVRARRLSRATCSRSATVVRSSRSPSARSSPTSASIPRSPRHGSTSASSSSSPSRCAATPTTTPGRSPR